jgi:chromosome segregation and condensation protein ScpB
MNREEQNEITLDKITAAIEAILFAAGHPVEYSRLSEVLGLSVKDVKSMVEVMSEECVELPERFRRRYLQPQPYTTLRGVASNTVHTMQSLSHGAEIENMEGAVLMAMAETMGYRAVEVRAISNRVGDSFDKWAVDEAVMALAKELKKLEDEK